MHVNIPAKASLPLRLSPTSIVDLRPCVRQSSTLRILPDSSSCGRSSHSPSTTSQPQFRGLSISRHRHSYLECSIPGTTVAFKLNLKRFKPGSLHDYRLGTFRALVNAQQQLLDLEKGSRQVSATCQRQSLVGTFQIQVPALAAMKSSWGLNKWA